MLTAKEALAGLELVVKEKGRDYVYDWPLGRHGGCVNVHDGQCSCLVGHVLVRMGTFTLAELSQSQINNDTVGGIWNSYPDRISSGAHKILSAAQYEQDHGETWGDALDAAREAALDIGADDV